MVCVSVNEMKNLKKTVAYGFRDPVMAALVPAWVSKEKEKKRRNLILALKYS